MKKFILNETLYRYWLFFINILCHTGWHFDQQAFKETPRIIRQGSEKFPGLQGTWQSPWGEWGACIHIYSMLSMNEWVSECVLI